MQKLKDAARSFLVEDEGATMVEYALIVAVIAIVALVGAKALGNAVNGRFNTTATAVTTP